MIKSGLALNPSTVSAWRKKITPSSIVRSGQKARTAIAAFAEAVILQSIEDLYDSPQRKESVDFFRGEGFRLYAKLAGMSREEQTKIFRMLADAGFRKYLFKVHSPKNPAVDLAEV